MTIVYKSKTNCCDTQNPFLHAVSIWVYNIFYWNCRHFFRCYDCWNWCLHSFVDEFLLFFICKSFDIFGYGPSWNFLWQPTWIINPILDDNSSGKHPPDDRSALFSFPGRWYHISVLFNSLTSLTRLCTNCLYCFFSFWIRAHVIPESFKHRTFDIGNLLVKAEYTLGTNLASNRRLINSNWGIVSTSARETLVFATIICVDTCPFL